MASLLVRAKNPGLIVGGDDEATRRLVRGLLTRGARIASLPSPARRAVRTATIGQWRRGSVRALVVPFGAVAEPGGLGRRDPAFVLVAGAPVLPDRRALLDLLHQLPAHVGPLPVVFVVTDTEAEAEANADAHVFGTDGCRRAALLDAVGEPVAVPCGRCDVCRGVMGDPGALLAPDN